MDELIEYEFYGVYVDEKEKKMDELIEYELKSIFKI